MHTQAFRRIREAEQLLWLHLLHPVPHGAFKHHAAAAAACRAAVVTIHKPLSLLLLLLLL